MMNDHPGYELFDELGRGENTVVYRGYDLDLGRPMAVKALDPEIQKDPQRIAQFLSEASFLAQFEHENILRIYSVDRERGWIVMELMEGTLESQITASAMSPDVVRSVISQVLSALDFLHQNGKIHGAVRPSNILINEQGRVKLSDFEAIESEGVLRAPTGSKKHLAPEVLRPEFGEFGPGLDLYRLGFTALELLTGPKFASLFPGTGQEAIDANVAWMRWHSSDEQLPPVKQICPQAPDDVASLLDQLLAKQVAERPQSAEAALALLSEKPFVPIAVEGKPTSNATAAPDSVSSAKAASVGSKPSSDLPSSARKTKSNQSSSGRHPAANKPSPLSTKDKVNEFLGKPYVLWPLCTAMMVGALLVGLYLQGDDEAPPNPLARVEFQIAPNAEGVQLYLNGQQREMENDRVIELAPGNYDCRVTKAGFDDFLKSIEVTEQDQQIAVRLVPVKTMVESQQANVRLRVTPEMSNLDVSIDGMVATPNDDGVYRLKPGSHLLRIEKSGYETHTETIELVAGEREIAIDLQPLQVEPIEPVTASVRLQILPNAESALVTFDGQAVTANAQGRFDLLPGAYQLRITKDGFEDFLQTVNIEPGTAEIPIVLRALPTARLADTVKVKVTMPADAQLEVGEDVVQFPEGKTDRETNRVSFEVEHTPKKPFAFFAEAQGFRPMRRSLSWEELVAAKFQVNVELERHQPSEPFEPDPGLVDPFASVALNLEAAEKVRQEKTAKLAREFTGMAELVIDSGGFIKELSDVSFSPDGKLLAAAGGKVVRIWNVQSGALVATLRGDRSRTSYGDVFAAQFSPDGKTLLVGVNDYKAHGSIREYSTADFTEIQRLIPGHTAPCRQIAFSGSGRRRISADADGNILIVDSSNDRTIGKIKASDANSPIFDLISYPMQSEDHILVLDYEGPKVFSPTGKALGPRDPMPDEIRGWFVDVFTQQVQYPFNTEKDPSVLDFALDRGEWLAAGVGKEEGRNRFWVGLYAARAANEAVGQSQPLQLYTGHRWSVTCLDLGPNGIAASGDKFGEVHVWNTKTGQRIHRFKGQGKSIYEAAFDRNSQRIAFGTQPYRPDVWKRNNYGNPTQVLDLQQRAILPLAATENLELSSEESKIGNYEVGVSKRVQDAFFYIDLKQRGSTISRYRMSSARNPSVFTLLPEPKLGVQRPVVFGDSEGLLALWDTSGKELRRAFVGHDSMVSGVSFSRNGKLMVSASTDRTIRIWSLQDYRPTGTYDFEFENTSVLSVRPGSSSAKAGVKVGDEIISMDGLSVTEIYQQMLDKRFEYKPGQVVPMRMKRNGREYTYSMTMDEGYDFEEPTLSFYVGDDNQWIIWSPTGYYDASPGADQLIGWHVNRGPDKSAKFFEVQQFREQLYRPDVINLILEGMDVAEAVRQANEERRSELAGRDFREPEQIAENHPPIVEILTPAAETTTRTDRISLSAQVTSPNGIPISEVTLLHNGNRAKVFRPSDSTGQPMSIKATVQLEPGNNRLELVAANGRATSEAVGVDVNLRAKRSSSQGDVHVLAIGLSEFKSRIAELGNLPAASKDAQEFSRAIRAHQDGRIYRNVNVRLLANQEATRASIVDGFQWLVDSVKPKDSVVIFFSGPAFVDSTDNFYLATHDVDVERPRATAVSWREFTGMLHEDLPECKRLVFLDAHPTAGGIRPGMRNPLLDLAAPELGTTFFASNTLQQKTPGTGSGAFVQAILQTLKDQAADSMPTPGDRLFNPVELAKSIRYRVQRSTRGKQLPTHFAAATQRNRNLFELLTVSDSGSEWRILRHTPNQN